MPLGITEGHLTSTMPNYINHAEWNICDNFTTGFPDKESNDAETDLDIETDASDYEYNPSEKTQSFDEDSNESNILSLSSPELCLT